MRKKSDLLLRDAIGVVSVWQLNGSRIIASGVISSLSADWKIVDGSDDYNGDGTSGS